MSVSALNPLLACMLTASRKASSADEAPSASLAAEVSAAKAAGTPSDANLTGSTTAAMSPETQATILNLGDLPGISITELRERMFAAYDTDKNGTVDDTEWQTYVDSMGKFAGDGAKLLDWRVYNPNAVSDQVYPSTLTVLPYEGPSGDGDTNA